MFLLEQAVWFYIGIIVSILALILIASIVSANKETTFKETMKDSMGQLQQYCNFVCNSDLDTKLSRPVTLVAGSYIWSEGKAICFNYKELNNLCWKCDCPVIGKDGSNFVFDLTEAVSVFETHMYECGFERDVNAVTMECKG